MKDENRLIEFPKNKRHEFLYFPILFVLLLIFKLFNTRSINEYFIPYMFIALGVVHIFASNILAYLYNLSYVALLIPLRVKPWFIKIIGGILILNSIRVILS